MSAPERREFDVLVREAVRCLRRNCKAAPDPKWRWEMVESLRYNPLAVAVEMVDAAIADGAREEDCYFLCSVLADRISRHFPIKALPVREAVQIETARESAANQAQIRLVCEPDSESALIEAEEKTAHEVQGSQLLLVSIRRKRLELTERRRPGYGQLSLSR